MKRSSALTRLIWDFYRENTQELQQLQLLQHCEVFRFWGRMYLRAQTPAMAARLEELVPLIEAPVEQLRLANRIKVLIGRKPVAIFDVGVGAPSTVVQERLP